MEELAWAHIYLGLHLLALNTGLFVLVKVKHLLKYFSWIEARVLMSNLQNGGHWELQI